MADQGKISITMTVPASTARGTFISGAGTLSASLRSAGVMEDSTSATQTKAPVQITGTCLIKAGAAFSAGASLVSDASGLAVAADTLLTEAIKITDSDTAASAGVAVYVHSKDGVNAWLEFVSPTNADGAGTLASGGSIFFVFDADGAATDGVALYFDEDATIASERLMIVSPSAQDLRVELENGKVITIKHNADAATDGVAVYLDEDAANSYDRLLFVSPTNADGVGDTDNDVVDISGNTWNVRAIALQASGGANELIDAVLI